MAARKQSRFIRSSSRATGNRRRACLCPAIRQPDPLDSTLDLAAILDSLSDATSLIRVARDSLSGREIAGDELVTLRTAVATLDRIYAVIDSASDLREQPARLVFR